jgi:4-hydroxy-3-methylbut-2-enyl diphosphate reductase
MLVIRPKKIILANPRGFCAGVDRAIEIVDIALKLYPAPIYVRHEIVHNHHVVNDFKNRGVIFIEELDEVPDSAKLIFSAHGTDPAVIEKAKARGIHFIDAVCPLVTKVHKEILKAVSLNKKIIYIGHRGHQEVVGAMGYAKEDIFLVEDLLDVEKLKSSIKKDEELILATQTTLSLDDTKLLVDTLQAYFTKIEFPKADDICYATQNRQDAVKELIRHCDHLLVIGSKNSSNTLRLVELAQKHSIPANLVSDPEQFDLVAMIPDLENKVIGISSGASAPERLIDILVSKLLGDPLYQNSRDFNNSDYAKNSLVEVLSVIEEKTYFKLPADLQLS